MIKKRYLFILACYSLVNWLSVSGNVFDEIKQALGAVSPGAQAQDSKIEEISKKIVDFDFNEESRQSLTDIVNKFLDWQKFPAPISQAINDAIKKWAASFTAREKNLKTDQQKISYNQDVKVFTEFVKSLNEIKSNLIPLAVLPKEVEIEPPWQTTSTLQEAHKRALEYVKKLVIQGLSAGELQNAKSNTESYLNTLNGICGEKGKLTEYLNSVDGKKDADFIGILLKTKNILGAWFSEDKRYEKLKKILAQAPELPVKPETPPPLPPRKDKLKIALTRLKTGLSNLKDKLKTLTARLNILKNNIAEASVELGEFKNTEEWWALALKHKSKITTEHEKAINQEWQKLYSSVNDKLTGLTGGVRMITLRHLIRANILDKVANKRLLDNIRKTWPDGFPDAIELSTQLGQFVQILDELKVET
jgi:hypothetical protein